MVYSTKLYQLQILLSIEWVEGICMETWKHREVSGHGCPNIHLEGLRETMENVGTDWSWTTGLWHWRIHWAEWNKDCEMKVFHETSGPLSL
jgi:hypothetical protein